MRTELHIVVSSCIVTIPIPPPDCCQFNTPMQHKRQRTLLGNTTNLLTLPWGCTKQSISRELLFLSAIYADHFLLSQVSEEERLANVGRHIWFDRRTEASQARYYFEALVLEFGLERVCCLPVGEGFLVHARPECLTLRPLRGCIAPAAPFNRHSGGRFLLLFKACSLLIFASCERRIPWR